MKAKTISSKSLFNSFLDNYIYYIVINKSQKQLANKTAKTATNTKISYLYNNA